MSTPETVAVAPRADEKIDTQETHEPEETLRSDTCAVSDTVEPIETAPKAEMSENNISDPPRTTTACTSNPESINVSEKPKSTHNEPSKSSPSAIACGLFRDKRVQIDYASGIQPSVIRKSWISGIPLVAIGLLDLANNSDFPANVFNERPVPRFAQVLMGLGGTFALIMACVALADARHSWRTIKLLRAERVALLSRRRTTAAEPDLDTFLHLNWRDLYTEYCERIGMELFMGGAVLLISIGTFMAIGGDDQRTYDASNLISGPIGNAPGAFYGLINAGWSVIMVMRAHKQHMAAMTLTGSVHAQNALVRRTKLVQIHGAVSGFTCLVSGAMGLMTPYYWPPYIPLAICAILFMYTTYLLRKRIAYVRPSMEGFPARVSTATVATEIDQLFDLQDRLSKRDSGPQPKNCTEETLRADLDDVLLSGSFETYCVRLLMPHVHRRWASDLAREKRIRRLVREQGISELTPDMILQLAAEIANEEGGEKEAQPPAAGEKTQVQDRLAIYNRLHWVYRGLHKDIEQNASLRLRFLLELLGSHLIATPQDNNVRQEPA